MDHEISAIEASIPESIEVARASKVVEVREENVLGVSYGTAIVGANVVYTASQIWDKNVTDFEYPDWGTVLANTAYAWGYGAPWLLEGQLESAEPDCGLEDFYSALESSPVPSLAASSGLPPALVRQAVQERDANMRAAVSCLQGVGTVFSLLDKLRAAALQRLQITQTILDSLSPSY